ncbi:hypothetical protein DU508_11200 [Pedobacter chinensis]|uniref:Uncharacterized protein n=1 Tax=Pedobacter chinensis TaxID=2282421 RepID=A0A369PY86_9SPHI|nr:hypothetical protein DU508_11200 [Pedobacter chinensis]
MAGPMQIKWLLKLLKALKVKVNSKTINIALASGTIFQIGTFYTQPLVFIRFCREEGSHLQTKSTQNEYRRTSVSLKLTLCEKTTKF